MNKTLNCYPSVLTKIAISQVDATKLTTRAQGAHPIMYHLELVCYFSIVDSNTIM